MPDHRYSNARKWIDDARSKGYDIRPQQNHGDWGAFDQSDNWKGFFSRVDNYGELFEEDMNKYDEMVDKALKQEEYEGMIADLDDFIEEFYALQDRFKALKAKVPGYSGAGNVKHHLDNTLEHLRQCNINCREAIDYIGEWS